MDPKDHKQKPLYTARLDLQYFNHIGVLRQLRKRHKDDAQTEPKSFYKYYQRLTAVVAVCVDGTTLTLRSPLWLRVKQTHSAKDKVRHELPARALAWYNELSAFQRSLLKLCGGAVKELALACIIP